MPTEQEEIDHVVNVILRQTADSGIALYIAQNGFTTIDMLLRAPEDMFVEGPYTDTQGNAKKLLRGHVAGLLALRAMSCHYNDKDTPIVDWTEITRDDYTTFIRQSYDGNSPKGTIRPSDKNNKALAVHDFTKGIKRDPDAYPKLVEGQNWDSYLRSFTIRAEAQGVEKVLDPEYKPKTPEDKLLFKKINGYMLMVFDLKFSTSQAKQAIQALSKKEEYPAQKVWAKVKEHQEKSTGASMEATDLLSYLSTVKWASGDYRWTDGVESFVRYFTNKLDEHDRLSDCSFTDELKITLLINATSTHPGLKSVRQQSDIMSRSTGKKQDYQEFCELMYSNAQVIDRESNLGKAKSRRANEHNWFTYDDTDYDEYEPIDIDTPVSALLVSKHDQSRNYRRFTPGSRMPKAKWDQIPAEHRKTWDQLPDNIKAIILSTQDSTPPTQVSLHDISALDYLNNNYRVNLSDMSAHELLSSMQDDGKMTTTSDTGTSDTPTSDEDRLLSAMQTRVQQETSEARVRHETARAKQLTESTTTSRPGTLAHVLSKTLGKPKSEKMTISNNNIQWICKVNEIMYNVSNHKQECMHALVDRGANGSVLGDDVRVIYKSKCKVDIMGIDQHTMNDIHICTAGGIIQTQHGPVIGIINQGAYTGRGHSILAPAQLEHFSLQVDDKSHFAGGTQCIATPDGYVIPIIYQTWTSLHLHASFL